MSNDNKLKIIVRYTAGAGGHFVSLLLLSLVAPTYLSEFFRGHNDIYKINNYHNFQCQWDDDMFCKCSGYTAHNVPISIRTAYLRTNYQFYESPHPIQVVHTHALNPDAILLAFDNTKLINITNTIDDIDQQSFNWVMKSCMLHQQWDILRKNLRTVQETYNRLKNIHRYQVSPNMLPRMLTYIEKYGTIKGRSLFDQFQPIEKYEQFNIKFNDILTGKLVEQIEDIANFLGLEPTPERLDNARFLATQYSKSQTIVPWKLSIDDYD